MVERERWKTPGVRDPQVSTIHKKICPPDLDVRRLARAPPCLR